MATVPCDWLFAPFVRHSAGQGTWCNIPPQKLGAVMTSVGHYVHERVVDFARDFS